MGLWGAVVCQLCISFGLNQVSLLLGAGGDGMTTDGNLDDWIFEREWDALIVLDACRYDYFERYYSEIPNVAAGELSRLRSPGSATPETMMETFGGRMIGMWCRGIRGLMMRRLRF